MPFHGCIVVIKRSGADGSTFPLVNEECLLGRAEGCDIRIQLPIVSKEHAKISVKVLDGSVFITALSRTNPTKLNGSPIDNDAPVELRHRDMFTIGDRHFRWEFPEGSPHHLRNTVSNGSVKESQPDEAEKILSPLTKAPTLPMEMPISKRLAVLEAEGTPTQYINTELLNKDLQPDTPVRKGADIQAELREEFKID
eukprot:GFUD01114642.1.p1 GENE.GFUD01114642.1~~GFUD01114642.1.p1  ORF type:complete len:197 (+),score=41.33 GFUD01114642.1:70-660(+)